MKLLDRLPWALTLFRAAAAPAPWLLWGLGVGTGVAAALIPLALLSDIFDGKIARARGVVTVLLRRADGWADLAFILSYTAFCIFTQYEALAPYAGWIIALAAFRGIRAILDFAKYGRGSAYHLWSAKLWGLAYYALLFQLLTGGPIEAVMIATLVLGFLNTAEGISATVLTPVWIVDAPHILAAMRKGRTEADKAARIALSRHPGKKNDAAIKETSFMPADPINDSALDTIFRTARTRNGWEDRPVGETLIQAVYDLARMGPTSANCSPARFVFVTSDEGKARLKPHLMEGNVEKTMTAPVCVIIGHDLEFYEKLPDLFPHTDAKSWFVGNDALIEETAFRNGTLQGAYLMIAARALGLDCGPMSGFDQAGVNEAFFAGTKVKANFICNIGYGTDKDLFSRSPRMSFDEACKVV